MDAVRRLTRSPIGVVARRELSQILRDKGFLISNLALLLMVVAGAVFALMRSGPEPESYTLGLVGADAADVVDVADAQADAFEIVLTAVEVDRERAVRGLQQGDLDAVIVNDEDILVEDGIEQGLQALLQSSFRQQQALAALDREGGDSGAVLERKLELRLLDTTTDPGAVVAALTGPVLIIFLYGYGLFIAGSVVEEKSSRVVEVVLAAVTPSELLAGKVIGIGLLGLVQLCVLVLLGAVTALLTGLGLSAAAAAALLLAVPWFVLGFLLYGSLFAVAGSVVSRQEDLQATQLPLLLLLLAVLGIATAQIPDPGSALARLLSLLPPFAPLVMPLRVGFGQASAAELVLAVSLTAASAYGLLRLAGRLHRNSLLRFGPRLRLREAWRGVG